jgi:protein phosphatase 1 regulatory subunit 7
MEGLHTVYFEHNPLQRNAGATYRNKIRLTLKAIKQIDATYVPNKEGGLMGRYVTAR